MKNTHIQIRLSADQKKRLQRLAKIDGENLSTWILKNLLSLKAGEFHKLMEELSTSTHENIVLAAFNDFLDKTDSRELEKALFEAPAPRLNPRLANIVAAMIEFAAVKKHFKAPEWIQNIKPLEKPYFVSRLKSLRPHLLISSPAAFKRRNLFVDTAVFGRV